MVCHYLTASFPASYVGDPISRPQPGDPTLLSEGLSKLWSPGCGAAHAKRGSQTKSLQYDI